MKILIGCPTYEKYEYCLDLWLNSVKQIIEFTQEKGHIVDYLLVDNSKTDDFYKKQKSRGIKIEKVPYVDNVRQRLVDSRNLLREKVIKEGYDFFFSLEQDVIPTEKDILIKLMNSQKKIISGYYGKEVGLTLQDNESGEIKKVVIDVPIIYLQQGEGVRRANPNEILDKGIIQVGAFGVGCLLIHREVLEKITFRFEEGKQAFDDFLFCSDAKKLGYGLFLESSIKVKHLHRPLDEILKD